MAKQAGRRKGGKRHSGRHKTGRRQSREAAAALFGQPTESFDDIPRSGSGEVAPSRTAGLALAIALAAVALAYLPVLLGGRTWVDRDSQRFFHPSRVELTESLRAGRLPEWSETVAFGNPFAGNPIHETFSPLGWLLALLATPFGYDLYELLHLGLLTSGFVLLALRLGSGTLGAAASGATAALCGYTATMVPNGLLDEVAWVPWVAWSACGLAQSGSASRAAPSGASSLAAASVPGTVTSGAWLVALLAFQLLSLEPAAVLTAGGCGLLFALAWVSHDRLLWVVGRFSLAVLAACTLSAVVLLPAWRLLEGSARGSGLESGGLEWSLHPARLIELVWPWFYGRPREDSWLAGLILRGTNADPFWAFSHFVGLPVLLSALAVRDRLQLRLLASSLPFLLLALGPATPLYGIGDVLPRLINFPEKFIYGALVFWLVAAGRGVHHLFEERVDLRWTVRLAGVGAVGVAAGLIRLLLQRSRLEAAHGAAAAKAGFLVDVHGAVGSSIVGGSLALASLVLFLIGLRWRHRREGGWLVLATLLAPLIVTSAATVNLASRDRVEATPRLVELIGEVEAPSPARVLRLDAFSPPGPFASADEMATWTVDSLETNIAGRFGLSAVRGFEPAQSRVAYEATTRLFQQMNPIAFMALFGVDFVVLDDPGRVTLPNTTLVGRDRESGWAVLENTYKRPRAFVTGSWRPSTDADAALDALRRPDRVEKIGLVHVVGATDRGDAGFEPVACERSTEWPEEVRLQCTAPASGYVVLLDEWARGWSATVDGEATEIHVADGLFRAVWVEAGPHEVVFRYRTPGLRVGAAISGLTLLLLGAGFSVAAARRRRPAIE